MAEGKSASFEQMLESAQERLGEGLDFNQVVLWKVVSVFASPRNSTQRDREIADLEEVLHAYHDEEYRERLRQLADLKATCKARHMDDAWDLRYQALAIEALMDLLKRAGLTPLGMV